MQATKSMSFAIKPTLFTKIDAYCKESGCSLDQFLSQAAENYLAELMEDKADYEDAVAALEEYEASGCKSYTAEEVFAQLGL